MHLFFYNIFCWLYRSAIRIAALWNPKARLWVKGRQDWFSTIKPQFDNTPGPWIWMHCASLGEFEQGRPVLEALRSQYPGYRILLTFFSPSGYEVRKNYPGADIVTYLPMDSKVNAMRFINMVNPSLVLWVKYEYWYYYLTGLRKKQVPVLLISGIFRKDQPFFKWYGRLHQYILESFSRLFVQNEASEQLLNGIGFKQVTVNGDTRFDRVAEIAAQFQPLPAIEAFCGNHPVIVAGSTWDADEEELDHYANTHPEIRFIIAPHEIEAPHLHDIEKLFKHTIRYSEWSKTLKADPAVNTLIIDNIGMLSKLYHYATITYIGGGFGKEGVHNVLEAAVYGKPVVFGPVYDKFIEADELVETGGGISIETALELEEVFNELLQDRDEYKKAASAAAQYVASKTGATQAVTSYIQENRLLTN
ncbi:MAG TPA: glycosyltransferase N-terminal domain-containing protein [Pseudobacter sp.]|nr:glycosyltransferase N-terminal domain-containing protein [Pseudobacter sp.]